VDLSLELVLYFLAFALLVIAGFGGVGRRDGKTVWYAGLNLPVLAAAVLVFAILILPLI
jgi:hypothetical protein